MTKVIPAILAGGSISGLMDISTALLVYGHFGVKPVRLLQGIATATAVYVLASRWIPALLYKPYLSGALYAVAVYFFMQCIVIPLSAIHRTPPSLKMTVIGLVIHLVCIGLPISLISRRFLLN